MARGGRWEREKGTEVWSLSIWAGMKHEMTLWELEGGSGKGSEALEGGRRPSAESESPSLSPPNFLSISSVTTAITIAAHTVCLCPICINSHHHQLRIACARARLALALT